MLTKERKAEIIKKYARNGNDTGCAEVQIALLTERINTLMTHFAKHKQDQSSNRGLLKMVGHRKSLLKYLERTPERYNKLIKELGIRK